MFRSILSAAALAAILAAPAGLKSSDGARLIPVTNGSCVTMDPDEKSGFTLTNTCGECRTAVITWCDGDAHEIDVHAHGTAHIDACRGIQTLLSDAPCQHR